MARRLATVGYFVVLPNLYYRLTRDFWLTERTEEKMAHMFSLMATLDAATTLCDTDAMLRYVDAHPDADGGKRRRGRLLHERAVRDVGGGRRPERLACIASIHGANMVTDQPDSPHRMAAGSAARATSPAPRSTSGRRRPTSRSSRRRCATRARRTASSGIPAPSTASSFRCAPASTTGPRPSATGSGSSACSSARCARRPDGQALERLGRRGRRPARCPSERAAFSPSASAAPRRP